jgi:hypothetical protein
MLGLLFAALLLWLCLGLLALAAKRFDHEVQDDGEILDFVPDGADDPD